MDEDSESFIPDANYVTEYSDKILQRLLAMLRGSAEHASDSAPRRPSVTRLSLLRCSPVAVEARPLAAPMAGTGRLAARRNARLLPTGRVAHGVAQRSRAVQSY